MLSKSLFALAVFATSVLAQGSASTSPGAPAPTGLAGITPCIIGCVTPAAISAGCVSFTNLSCVCSSSAFQAAAGACLQANCTAADQAAGLALQTQQCGALTASTSKPSSTYPAATSSGPGPTTSTKTGSAMGLHVGTGLIGAVVLSIIGITL